VSTPNLSITDYAVLGLLAEGPAHGFAISRTLSPTGDVGRFFAVRRPLVYRALDRLVDLGYARPMTTEKGTAGPDRTIVGITSAGSRRLTRWLAEPVERIRDLRIEFLLKLTLLLRSQRSPSDLIQSQLQAFEPTLAELEGMRTAEVDHIELWRLNTSAAAISYLEDLGRRHPPSAPFRK
jgi:PadR family transcriptional regulator AphA